MDRIEKGGFEASDPNQEDKMTGSDETRSPDFSAGGEKESSLEKSDAEVQREISEKIDAGLQILAEIAPIVEANEKKIEEGGLTSPAELRRFNGGLWYVHGSSAEWARVKKAEEFLGKVSELVALGEDMLARNGLQEGVDIKNDSLPENIKIIFDKLGFDKPWQKRKLSSLPELKTGKELDVFINEADLKATGYIGVEAGKFYAIIGIVLEAQHEGKVTKEEAQSSFEELKKWAGVEGEWNF